MRNERIADDVYRLKIPVDWESFDPGQFVMLDIPGPQTFLRRPFGIAGLSEGVCEICYKVVGKGTMGLSECKEGTELSALGPCGRGFSVDGIAGRALLVAGGYGIAPIYALACRLERKGMGVDLFYGAKRAGDLVYIDELKSLGAKLHLTTEDGSMGERGIVTDLVERELRDIPKASIFACGPKGLLGAVAAIGRKLEIHTQVSLERYMACGMGVCLGCVCKDLSGKYVRVCREGPAFDVLELGEGG